LGVVDPDEVTRYISSLPESNKRKELLKLFIELPYQRVNDSPTLKHYTEWEEYDRLSLSLRAQGERIRPILPLLKPADKYVIIVDNEVIEGNLDLSSEPYNSVISPSSEKLVALTLATAGKLKVTRGGKYFIYHVSTSPLLFSPLNVEVEAGKGEKIELFYMNRVEAGMGSLVLGARGAEGSSVKVRLVNLGNSSHFYLFSRMEIEGELELDVFSSGTRLGHAEIKVDLGEGARSSFKARAFGVRDNKIDLKVDVNHVGPYSSSQGLLKAVAADEAYTSIRGVASISSSAPDSSTSIIGRSLLISRGAKAVVTPMLEVKTGKIREARHSASASKVSEDSVFYLQSRGVDRKTAEGLIIRGFLLEEGDPSEVLQVVEESLTKLGYTKVEPSV